MCPCYYLDDLCLSQFQLKMCIALLVFEGLSGDIGRSLCDGFSFAISQHATSVYHLPRNVDALILPEDTLGRECSGQRSKMACRLLKQSFDAGNGPC